MLLRHALPNALVPTLNVTALNLAYLVGGVVVVEKVFSYPGFGSLLVDSLQLRDLPVIEATVMIAALVYVARQPAGRHRRDPAQSAAADRHDHGERADQPSGAAAGAASDPRAVAADAAQFPHRRCCILIVHLLVAVTGPFWAPYGYSPDGHRHSAVAA